MNKIKDYYKILGISKSASELDIKKAYRNLAIKHHPDKNNGSKESENIFKDIAEAYDILGNPSKKMEYDSKIKPKNDNEFNRNNGFYQSGQGSSFDDWVKSARTEDFYEGDHYSRGRRSTNTDNRVPDTRYLDIYDNAAVNLSDILLDYSLIVNYKYQVTDMSTNVKELNRTLNIDINIRKKCIDIVKINDEYFIKLKLDNMGNEGMYKITNAFGKIDYLPLFGDYHLNIKINKTNKIEIEGYNIIQYVDISLHDVLFNTEKIRITTILGKSYDAEISAPSKLNNLKFNIKNHGLINKNGTFGDYIIKFNIISPDLSSVSKSNLKIIKESFYQKIEN